MKKFMTNYLVAVNWLGNSRVMCNNIPNIDPTVWDNLRFSLELEDGCTRDIFTWYITDCDDREVEYLEDKFGLLFTYSELLAAWILCVDHYGTNWGWVECETSIESAARALGESI